MKRGLKRVAYVTVTRAHLIPLILTLNWGNELHQILFVLDYGIVPGNTRRGTKTRVHPSYCCLCNNILHNSREIGDNY